MSKDTDDKSIDKNDFLDVLSLMASSDPNILLTASDLFIEFSFKDPNTVFKYLDEVELLLISICSSNAQRWCVVSSILFGLSHVVNQIPTTLKKRLHTFIRISHQISQAFLSSYSHSSYNFPIQFYFVEAILNNFDKSWKLSKTSFLQITENCTIGSVCKTTFLHLLILKFEDVLEMALKFEYDELMLTVQHISSPDKNVMRFYLTLWVCLMVEKIEDSVAIRVLRTQSEALLKIKKNPDDYQVAAEYLFDIVKTPLKCQKDMVLKGMEIKEKVCNLLKTSQESSHHENYNYKKQSNKSDTHSQIFKTQVSVLYNKLVSKKWRDKMELRLVEEASILYWAKNEVTFSKGVAIQCSDIEELVILPKKKDLERENVIKIQLRSDKKAVYYLAFQSADEAKQWSVLIQNMNTHEGAQADADRAAE